MPTTEAETTAAALLAALLAALKAVDVVLGDRCDFGVLDLHRDYPLWMSVRAAIEKAQASGEEAG